MARLAPRGHVAAHGALVVAAFAFGSSFAVVKTGVEDMTPMAYLALRYAIGTVVMAPAMLRPRSTPGFWRAGAGVGAVLLVGYVTQTIGLQYTTTSSSAFVTGLFVMFALLWAALLLRRLPGWRIVGAAAAATVGLFLLTGADVHLGKGDALTLLCAVSFGLHVALLARYCPDHPPLALNAVQLGVVAIGCAVALPFTGIGHVTGRALASAAFTGVFVSALGISLQMYAQQFVGPNRAALLLTLEPVFAGVIGYTVGDRFDALGWTGALLILAAVVFAETAPPARRTALDRPV